MGFGVTVCGVAQNVTSVYIQGNGFGRRSSYSSFGPDYPYPNLFYILRDSCLHVTLPDLNPFFSVSSLLQQPLNPLQRILDQLMTNFHVREETPEPVRQSRIHIQPRLHAAFLAQLTLIDQPFVPQRIHAADLEVRWWQILVAVWVGEGRVEGRGLVGFVGR